MKNELFYSVILFLIAFLIRAFFAFFYFGCSDVNAMICFTQHTMTNDLTQITFWNIFPGICIYFWLEGFLNIFTCLPVAFCMKLIFCLFDSLLVLLIYKILCHKKSNYSFTGALLYALCPISVFVCSIHGQWDSLFLFFLILAFYFRDFFADSIKKNFAFGIFFGYAFLLKPTAIIFFPFFFIPYEGAKKLLGKWWFFFKISFLSTIFFALFFFLLIKIYSLDLTHCFLTYWFIFTFAILIFFVLFFTFLVRLLIRSRNDIETQKFIKYLKLQLASLSGFLSIIILGLFIFKKLGFSILWLVDSILRYLNHGIQHCGLPFAYPFSCYPFRLFLQNRIWLMVVIFFIAYKYYQKKIDAFAAITFCFVFIIGFLGFLTHYILWIIPFVLINDARFLKWLAFYNIAGSFFYVFYYSSPFCNPAVLFQHALSFAPLKCARWLLPPAWSSDYSMVYFIKLWGNYMLPIISLTLALYVFIYSIDSLNIVKYISQKQKFRFFNLYFVFNVCLIFFIGILILLFYNPNLRCLFEQITQVKRDWYIPLGTGYQANPFFNILTFIMCWSIIWSLAAYFVSIKFKMHDYLNEKHF